MIARHDAQPNTTTLWSALAAPLPASAISWRQDGRAVQRDGRWYARFLSYVDANTVRERLDAVVPGEWDLTLDLLPSLQPAQSSADDESHGCSFKARLQILGVIREDVGTGRDYKSAATDAFKRAAVRFGIAHELYAMEPNWVLVDGEGRYARALEDPQTAYDRRVAGRRGDAAATPARDGVVTTQSADVVDAPHADALLAAGRSADEIDADAVRCPQCAGRMWDNRLTKRNPKAPDFKCRDRSCDGVIWPPRGQAPAGGTPAGNAPAGDGPRANGTGTTAPAGDESAPARKRAGGRAKPDAGALVVDASPLGGTDDDDIPF